MGKDSSGTELCTKCEKNPRGNGHDWCNPCKAELQRRYAADKEELFEQRGFAKGCEAMRDALLAGFGQMHPNGILKPNEVAANIVGCPRPQFQRRVAATDGA